MKRHLPLVLAAIMIFPLLTAALAVIFIPTSEVEAVAQRTARQQGYVVRARHMGKAFPIGIKARGVEISDSRGSLLKLDTLSARIALLPLCIGRIVVCYHGEIGNGSVEGTFSPNRNPKLSLKVDGVQLQDIPLFETVCGARVSGELHTRAEFSPSDGIYGGEIRLWVKNAIMNGVKVSGMPLPDAAFETVQGKYTLKRGRGTLESLTLQGRGIYMRLSGDVPAASPPASAPLNLTLELMPKPEFLEGQKLVFLLLAKYLDTPGHYRIPIRGTPAKPVIE